MKRRRAPGGGAASAAAGSAAAAAPVTAAGFGKVMRALVAMLSYPILAAASTQPGRLLAPQFRKTMDTAVASDAASKSDYPAFFVPDTKFLEATAGAPTVQLSAYAYAMAFSDAARTAGMAVWGMTVMAYHGDVALKATVDGKMEEYLSNHQGQPPGGKAGGVSGVVGQGCTPSAATAWLSHLTRATTHHTRRAPSPPPSTRASPGPSWASRACSSSTP